MNWLILAVILIVLAVVVVGVIDQGPVPKTCYLLTHEEFGGSAERVCLQPMP